VIIGLRHLTRKEISTWVSGTILLTMAEERYYSAMAVYTKAIGKTVFRMAWGGSSGTTAASTRACGTRVRGRYRGRML